MGACGKNVEEDVSTWRKISIVIGGGACDNVISHVTFLSKTVFESVESKKGQATRSPISETSRCRWSCAKERREVSCGLHLCMPVAFDAVRMANKVSAGIRGQCAMRHKTPRQLQEHLWNRRVGWKGRRRTTRRYVGRRRDRRRGRRRRTSYARDPRYPTPGERERHNARTCRTDHGALWCVKGNSKEEPWKAKRVHLCFDYKTFGQESNDQTDAQDEFFETKMKKLEKLKSKKEALPSHPVRNPTHNVESKGRWRHSFTTSGRRWKFSVATHNSPTIQQQGK